MNTDNSTASNNGCFDPNAFVVNDTNLSAPKLKEAILKAPSMPPDAFGDHSYQVIVSGYEFDNMNRMLLDTKQGQQVLKHSSYTNPTEVLWPNPEGDSYNINYGGRLYQLSIYAIPFTQYPLPLTLLENMQYSLSQCLS
jgi:hypothetical protein